MDGTFGSKNAELNIQRVLKRGYNVKIVYVYQDPKLAWQFTLAREKIEHRSIRFDGFVEAYYNTIQNIKTIYTRYNNQLTIDLVFKTTDNAEGGRIKNVNMDKFDDIVKPEYNKNKLISYIKGKIV